MSAWWVALREHWRKAVHWVIVAVAVAFLAWRVPRLVGDVAQSGRLPESLRWAWVAVAVVCSIGALGLYGEMHRRLLLVGGARLPIPVVQGINAVENAVENTLVLVALGALALGWGGRIPLVLAVPLAALVVLAAMGGWAVPTPPGRPAPGHVSATEAGQLDSGPLPLLPG